MNIALLGTGLMGKPMALQLQQSGHTVFAWNRTASKLAPLQAAGIRLATSPAEAIAAADVIVLMLTNLEAIETVLLTAECETCLRDRTVIQMGTIAPAESQQLAAQLNAVGSDYLEAPVLGSIPQAQSGALILMVGASPTLFERWRPILQCFGPDPKLLGPVGAGATVKLAMNQLIGTLTAAFAMSLAIVQRAEIDPAAFMEIVRDSALYAPTFDKKLQRLSDRNFANPNFPTKHLLKDLNLFVQAAQAQGVDARTAAAVSEVAQQAIALGFADSDYSALFAAINPLTDSPH
ncbi:MAG: NAD(P)-dependent oxidoreductase [Cyanobacteria bacterium P01_H01_bin.121]